MNHTVIIGLEVHVQLQTKSKIFCGCSADFNPDHPNVQTCPVCLGLPGALPVMNREAFELGVKTALALNCEISSYTKWDRKHYYYPDLPKGFQISQFDLPFSEDGFLEIETNPETGERRRIGIIRAHLEEDAGKNLHDDAGRSDSQVDLNRAGTPLLEIVSQPDMRTAAEATKYLQELRLLLTYLGVSDCNMQEGSLRCDANVNLHIHQDDGHKVPTPIVEVKNLNSFRNVEIALEYEVQRQLEAFKATGIKFGDKGGHKTTRGFDAGTGKTTPQREKEDSADYRYFPDPDLLPVTVTEDYISSVREALPEFPADRRKRFVAAYQLSDYDVQVIVDQGRGFGDYFEEVAKLCGDGKQACNWVTQDILRELKERKLEFSEFPISAPVLGDLLGRITKKKLTTKSAREIFMDLLDGNGASTARIDEIIAAKGLAIVEDTGAIEKVIATVIDKNAKAVADFKAGKQAAVGALIGQVMREVKGADPQKVREMLIAALSQR